MDAEDAPQFTAETLESMLACLRATAARMPGTAHADLSLQDLTRVATVLEVWQQNLSNPQRSLDEGSGLGRFVYSTQKLVECIRLSSLLKGGASRLADVVIASLSMTLPAYMREPYLHVVKNHRTLPSETLVRRSELALDISILGLANNRLRASVGSFTRSGLADSSPVRGVEWLWSQYSQVQTSDVIKVGEAFETLAHAIQAFVTELRVDVDGEEDDITIPVEPLAEWVPLLKTLADGIFENCNTPVALGSGHRGLADKAGGEVFKANLEARDDPRLLEQIMDAYEDNCADMGVEQGLPDFQMESTEVGSLLPDFFSSRQLLPVDVDDCELEEDYDNTMDLHSALGGDEEVAGDDPGHHDPHPQRRFLMPNSLGNAGVQHQMSNLNKDVHKHMVHWKTFHSHLKVIESLLRLEERRSRFVWTCLRGTQWSRFERLFEHFRASLYEDRWA